MGELKRSEQEVQDTVKAVGSFFPIPQHEEKLRDAVDHMGKLRFWDKDARVHLCTPVQSKPL